MTSTLRRILTSAAVTGLLCLGAAGPAAAEYEGGSGPYSVTREGYVDDADLVLLRTGLGSLLGLGLVASLVAGHHGQVARRRGSGRPRGTSRQLGDLEPAPRPGLA